MNIPNDRSVIINKVRHLEGEAFLHEISISKPGKVYFCTLTVSGKFIEGTCPKKVDINTTKNLESCYSGAWSKEIFSAIGAFDQRVEEERLHRLSSKLASENIEQMCEGKKGYRTPEFAEKRCREVQKRIGEELNYYFCQYCFCYHIGHVPWWTKS